MTNHNKSFSCTAFVDVALMLLGNYCLKLLSFKIYTVLGSNQTSNCKQGQKALLYKKNNMKSRHPPITFPKTTKYHNVAGFRSFNNVASMFNNYCLKMQIYAVLDSNQQTYAINNQKQSFSRKTTKKLLITQPLFFCNQKIKKSINQRGFAQLFQFCINFDCISLF